MPRENQFRRPWLTYAEGTSTNKVLKNHLKSRTRYVILSLKPLHYFRVDIEGLNLLFTRSSNIIGLFFIAPIFIKIQVKLISMENDLVYPGTFMPDFFDPMTVWTLGHLDPNTLLTLNHLYPNTKTSTLRFLSIFGRVAESDHSTVCWIGVKVAVLCAQQY